MCALELSTLYSTLQAVVTPHLEAIRVGTAGFQFPEAVSGDIAKPLQGSGYTFHAAGTLTVPSAQPPLARTGGALLLRPLGLLPWLLLDLEGVEPLVGFGWNPLQQTESSLPTVLDMFSPSTKSVRPFGLLGVLLASREDAVERDCQWGINPVRFFPAGEKRFCAEPFDLELAKWAIRCGMNYAAFEECASVSAVASCLGRPRLDPRREIAQRVAANVQKNSFTITRQFSQVPLPLLQTWLRDLSPDSLLATAMSNNPKWVNCDYAVSTLEAGVRLEIPGYLEALTHAAIGSQYLNIDAGPRKVLLDYARRGNRGFDDLSPVSTNQMVALTASLRRLAKVGVLEALDILLQFATVESDLGPSTKPLGETACGELMLLIAAVPHETPEQTATSAMLLAQVAQTEALPETLRQEAKTTLQVLLSDEDPRLVPVLTTLPVEARQQSLLDLTDQIVSAGIPQDFELFWRVYQLLPGAKRWEQPDERVRDAILSLSTPLLEDTGSVTSINSGAKFKNRLQLYWSALRHMKEASLETVLIHIFLLEIAQHQPQLFLPHPEAAEVICGLEEGEEEFRHIVHQGLYGHDQIPKEVIDTAVSALARAGVPAATQNLFLYRRMLAILDTFSAREEIPSPRYPSYLQPVPKDPDDQPKE